MPEKKIKVLLVEDDEYVNRAYGRKFKHENFEVIIAEDGKQGLEEARRQKPDIILLDIIMPVMNGFDFLREFKKDGANKDVPVIVLTNLSQSDDRDQVMKLGATDFWVKSDTGIAEVVKKIREYTK